VGPEVDIWSLGVVLHCMLTCEFPFNTIGDILKGKLKETERIPKDCIDLLKEMLVVKKEDRATLEFVLNHRWIVNTPESDSVGPSEKRRKVEDAQ